MNKVILSGTILNHPIKCIKTKNGKKVLNNQIEVSRSKSSFTDYINFTAWGELAELLTKANENTIVELSGEWRVENFKDKNGNAVRRDVLLVDKVDFVKIDIEEVQEQDFIGNNLEGIEISEDDLPF